MKRILVPIFLLILCLLGGCAGLSAEELYCLPEASQDYYDLQTALSQVLSEGYSYHAPSAGARREPVQLIDLDGDGADEAVAYLKDTQNSAVVACIFDKNGEAYEKAALVEASGSAISSVEYADMDGDGASELLLTCQVSESVTQAIQVFRYQERQTQTLLTAPCSRSSLVDLDHDGAKELLTLTDAGADSPAEADYFRFQDQALTGGQPLSLSGSYSGILNLQEGDLSDGSGAVIVTIDSGDQIITDVLIQGDAGAEALDTGNILKTDRIRGSILPKDVNNDGCMEIPKATMLRPDENGTALWAVSWYALDRKGGSEAVAMTYHDISENWYMDLPETWLDQVTVIENPERKGSVIFCRLEEQGALGQEILTVYVLKGESRQEDVTDLGLTTLHSDADRILAIRLNDAAQPWEGTVTMAEVSERFHVDSSDN